MMENKSMRFWVDSIHWIGYTTEQKKPNDAFDVTKKQRKKTVHLFYYYGAYLFMPHLFLVLYYYFSSSSSTFFVHSLWLLFALVSGNFHAPLPLILFILFVIIAHLAIVY